MLTSWYLIYFLSQAYVVGFCARWGNLLGWDKDDTIIVFFLKYSMVSLIHKIETLCKSLFLFFQKRRIGELLSESIPKDEAKLLSNGRFVFRTRLATRTTITHLDLLFWMSKKVKYSTFGRMPQGLRQAQNNFFSSKLNTWSLKVVDLALP